MVYAESRKLATGSKSIQFLLRKILSILKLLRGIFKHLLGITICAKQVAVRTLEGQKPRRLSMFVPCFMPYTSSKILYLLAHFNVNKMSEDLGTVVDEIMNAVGSAASKEDVEGNLKKFIEYGVPVEQAKQAVIKKYGGIGFSSSGEKKLGSVEPNDKRLGLLGKIVAVEEREVDVKGEKKRIFRGLIGDETAVLSFTAWKDFGLEQDDVVRIKNAYAGEWGGQPRLNFSEWTEVEKTDDSIDLVKRKAQHYTVIDLKPGLSNVEVRVKLLTMEERDVNVGDESKKVYTGLMGDKTGKIRYTSWSNFDVKEGDVVEIKGAYTKSWRGTPQLVFDENAKVGKLDEVMPVEMVGKEKISIYKIVEAGGGVDLNIEGVIIEVQAGSGLIYRCPKCRRAIRDGVCVIDGEVEGIPDLRIKAVVDDGTGAVNAIFDRNTTEKLTGKTLGGYEKMAVQSGEVPAVARKTDIGEVKGSTVGAEEMKEGVVENDIKNLLVAHPVHVVGNALSDDYGVTVIVQDADIVTPAIQEERDKILAKMEAMK